MVNNAQADLTNNSQVLRTLAAVNDMEFGIYARVIAEGPVHVGDELYLLGRPAQ
jgi:MOSC domain-containing protein YiiM